MAKIIIQNNVFDSSDKDVYEVDEGQSVKDFLYSKNIDKRDFSATVECYDPETDTTYFIPITDESEVLNIAVNVNGANKTENYEIKKDDIIIVAILPASKEGLQTAGIITTGAATAVGIAALIFPPAALVLGIIAGGLGLVSAGLFVAASLIDSDSNTSKKAQKAAESDNGKSNPTISGSSNQSLIGNAFPLVIGKQTVTPFIGGDVVTYLDNAGLNMSSTPTPVETTAIIVTANGNKVYNGTLSRVRRGYPDGSIDVDEGTATSITFKVRVGCMNANKTIYARDLNSTTASLRFASNPALLHGVGEVPFETMTNASRAIGKFKSNKTLQRILVVSINHDMDWQDAGFETYVLGLAGGLSASNVSKAGSFHSVEIAVFNFGSSYEERSSWRDGESKTDSRQCELGSYTSSTTPTDRMYSRLFGQVEYMEELLVIGYSPVFVKNICFDLLQVSKNPNNVMSGMLKYNTSSAGEVDNDDNLHTNGATSTFNGKIQKREIGTTWNNNKIQMELSQFGENRTLYPYVVKQDEVNASLLYCYDQQYSEIETSRSITWQGGTFPTGMRTQTIHFSASMPMKVTVGIDFPQGLFMGWTDSDGNVCYNKIPMNLVVQWRPLYKYVRDNNLDNDYGSSFVYNNKASSPAYDTTRYGRWRNFDSSPIVPKITYTSGTAIIYRYYAFNNVPCGYGSAIGYIDSKITRTSMPTITKEGLSDDGTFTFHKTATNNYRDTSFREATIASVGRDIASNADMCKELGFSGALIGTRQEWKWKFGWGWLPYWWYDNIPYDNYSNNASAKATIRAYLESVMAQAEAQYLAHFVKDMETIAAPSTPTSKREVELNYGLTAGTSNDSNPNWNGVECFSFGKFSCGPKGYQQVQTDPSISALSNDDVKKLRNLTGAKDEMKFELSATLTPEDILDLMNKNPKTNSIGTATNGLLDETDVIMDSIEVRVIRLTPCYIDKQKKNGDNYISYKYSDLVKWSYLKTEVIDSSKLKKLMENSTNGNKTVADIDVAPSTYTTSNTWKSWNPEDFHKPLFAEEDASRLTTLALRVYPDKVGYINGKLDKIQMDVYSVTPAMKDSHVRYWYKNNNSYYYYDSCNDYATRADFMQKSWYKDPVYNAADWTPSTAEEFAADAPAQIGTGAYYWVRKNQPWDKRFYPEAVHKKTVVETAIDFNGNPVMNDDEVAVTRDIEDGNTWLDYIKPLTMENKDSLQRSIATTDFLETFTEQNAIGQALGVLVSPALGKDAKGYNSTALLRGIRLWCKTADGIYTYADTLYDTVPSSSDISTIVPLFHWNTASESLFRSSGCQEWGTYTKDGSTCTLYWNYYDCSEDINMLALKEAYSYTNGIDIGRGARKYCSNLYVYSQKKLQSLLQTILYNARAYWFYDDLGRIEIHNDRALKNPVMLINDENSTQDSNSRAFVRSIGGYHITFKDENNYGKQGEIYVLRPGQEKEKHTRNIVDLNLEGVTNGEQARDFAMYLMAQSIAQRETWTRSLKRGYRLTIGSLVELQSSSLRIGTDTGGTILKLLKDDDYIYGFILDREYLYRGEYNEDGTNKHGCSIMQVKAGVNSQIVTVRFAGRDAQENGIAIDGVTYSNLQGETNLVLFDKKISIADEVQVGQEKEEDTGTTLATQFVPSEGDIVAFGEIGAITSKAIVSSLEPDEKGGVKATFFPYYDEVYTPGNKYPVYSSNLTRVSPSGTIPVSTDVSRQELRESVSDSNLLMTSALRTSMLALNDGTFDGSAPGKVTGVTAVAGQDEISIQWSTSGSGLKNTIQYYRVDLTKNDGASFTTYTPSTNSLKYRFDRNKSADGYPEKSDLSTWFVRVKAVNTYGMESEDWSDDVYVDTSSYLTWQPEAPSVITEGVRASKDGISFGWNDVASKCYGRIYYVPYVTYSNETRNTGATYETKYQYVFDRSVDGYPEKESVASSALKIKNYKVSVKAVNLETGKNASSSEVTVTETGYKTWVPTPVTNLVAIAERDTITLNWNDNSASYADGKKYSVYRNGVLIMSGITGCAYTYTFDRSKKEYPESTDFLSQIWEFKVRTENESTASISTNKADSASAAYKLEDYGTWRLQTPEVTQRVNNRTVILTITQPARADKKTIYGNIISKVRIKRRDNSYVDSHGETVIVPADSQWYAPATSADPFGNEDNYKDPEDTKGYVLATNETYVQTLPLYGQGADGSLNNLIDTAYAFDVQSYNESMSTSWVSEQSTPIMVTAAITSMRDIVKANETAAKAYISELSAISANLGSISQGNLTGNNRNYWNLSTKDNPQGPSDYQGAFRVGGEDQYLQVTPEVDEGTGQVKGYSIELKAGNIRFTGSTSDNTNTGTYIYDTASNLNRLALTYRGMEIQTRESGSSSEWNSVGIVQVDANGNLIITNKPTNTGMLMITTKPGIGMPVYHFDTDDKDDMGTNLLGLTCSGSVAKGDNVSFLMNGGGVWDGTVERNMTTSSEYKQFSVLSNGGRILLDGTFYDLNGQDDNSDVSENNARVSTDWGLTEEQAGELLFTWE